MLEKCSNPAHSRTEYESRHINLERRVFDDPSIIKNKSIRISYYGERIHGMISILLDRLSSKILCESEFL
jgi:hypothetical protein